MVIESWKQLVGEYYGQSDAAHAFIKEVKSHILSYKALREADKRHPDPKDTFENLIDIRRQAHDLGMALMESDNQVISYISQGKFLAKNTPNEPIEADELGQELVYIAWAIDVITKELGGDADIKRRGYHKHMARNMLVKSICESYSERLNEYPGTSNENFTSILESILDTLGLPSANLHRVLKDSIPPASTSH